MHKTTRVSKHSFVLYYTCILQLLWALACSNAPMEIRRIQTVIPNMVWFFMLQHLVWVTYPLHVKPVMSRPVVVSRSLYNYTSTVSTRWSDIQMFGFRYRLVTLTLQFLSAGCASILTYRSDFLLWLGRWVVNWWQCFDSSPSLRQLIVISRHQFWFNIPKKGHIGTNF